jgi:gliding motility-associated-like protein
LSSIAGNNEFFVNYNGIEEFNCIILNRWGNVIHQYTDPAGVWDGTNQKSGKLVTEGTYFYKIDATFEGGESTQKHGFVVLKY